MTQFTPEVVTTESDVAEMLRMPMAQTAAEALEVLRETDAVAIKLRSSWWGNEAFGVWGEWFFVVPDGVSPSGKALFVRKGTSLSEATGKLRSAKSMRESRGGWTGTAAAKTERKAFDWFDTKTFGPGAPPSENRASFKDESCPLSVVETAFRTPESDDHPLFTPAGVTAGKLSEADVVADHLVRTRYGTKLAFVGDTYAAFNEATVSRDDEEVAVKDALDWDAAHATWNGDHWVCDVDGFEHVAGVLTEAGMTVGVSDAVRGNVEAAMEADDEAKSLMESFGAC